MGIYTLAFEPEPLKEIPCHSPFSFALLAAAPTRSAGSHHGHGVDEAQLAPLDAELVAVRNAGEAHHNVDSTDCLVYDVPTIRQGNTIGDTDVALVVGTSIARVRATLES